MKQITFYLDFISPYAYLAFEHLPVALQGLSYSVAYRPVLFAALLGHHGQLGPAEIPGKREWTYRHMLWQARQLEVALRPPAAHPFNPLPLLRLAVAAGGNRYACERLFRHVWLEGGDPSDAERLASVTTALAPARDPQSEEVKAELKRHTDEALAAGAFGVPSLVADGRLFWGVEGLALLRAYLEGDTFFAADGPWDAGGHLPVGMGRPRRSG